MKGEAISGKINISRKAFGLGSPGLENMWQETEKPAYEELLHAKDVKFFVDGECISPSEVMEVAEEDNYMVDYVFGKEGKISEIRFDRVDQE